MAFFSKKNEEKSEELSAFKAEPRKAAAWFERAKTVSDSRQYDFAIECYISGLKFDPQLMNRHEDLREVALRRKVGGGKPVGMIEAMKRGAGKSDIEKMLNAEYMWSKDPFNVDHVKTAMEYAVALGFEELAFWFGGLAMDANRAAKKPEKKTYLEIRDLFAAIGAFEKAVEACRMAVMMDQSDMKLLKEMHDLEAERTVSSGRYDEGGSFRESVVDMDKQEALLDEDGIARSEGSQDEVIKRAAAAYKEKSDDVETLQKYVRALLDKEEEESENKAIEVLMEAYKNIGQYRFKMQSGDVRIKQYNREIRELNEKVEGDPENEGVKVELRRIAMEQVQFELGEFEERVKNYPTDLSLRFNLGRRQLAVKDYDSSIASFQEARADPRYRAMSLRYLGEAFAAKKWFDEAIDTFREGIKAHQFTDDKLALAMRYHLMNSLEHKARKERRLDIAEEGADIASKIAQSNFNYMDMRDRLEALRSLDDELRKEGG